MFSKDINEFERIEIKKTLNCVGDAFKGRRHISR